MGLFIHIKLNDITKMSNDILYSKHMMIKPVISASLLVSVLSHIPALLAKVFCLSYDFKSRLFHTDYLKSQVWTIIIIIQLSS